jgi:anti-anti-sigma factor
MITPVVAAPEEVTAMASSDQGMHGHVVLGEHTPGRLVAALSGDLDLAVADDIAGELRSAVDRARPRTLALDLMAVDFCDCAALRALLIVRAECARVGCRMVISAMSPAMRWLLELTELDAVFGHPDREPGASNG